MAQELFGQLQHDPPLPVTIIHESGEETRAHIFARWLRVEPGVVSREPLDTREIFVRFDDGALAVIDTRDPRLDGENVTLSNIDYP